MLAEKGVNDERLIEAIASVIIANNKAVEEKVTDLVSKDFMAGFRKMGMR